LWRDQFSNIILGSWKQNFAFPADALSAWRRVRVSNLDSIQTFSAEEVLPEDLIKRFNWRAGLGPRNYSAIVELERPWRQAAHLTKVWDLEEGLVTAKGLESPKKEPPAYVALLDCEDILQFVVVLQKASRYPGGVDVYDSKGMLVAHSLTDMNQARHQFVDTQGHLLVTAEAPGLNQNISFANIPLDPAMGDVFTYVMKFELGSYSGASQLLEPDFRWILAAAVQMRAVIDGRTALPPMLPEILPVIYWIVTAIFIALVGLSCWCTTITHAKKLPKIVAQMQAQAQAAQQAEEQATWTRGGSEVPPWWQDGKVL